LTLRSKGEERQAGQTMPPRMEVTGIDHVYLSVLALHRSEQFYDAVMIQTLGFRKKKFVLASDPHIHYFNRHFGFVVRPARIQRVHQPYAPGLHHFCFRVDRASDVERIAKGLQSLGIAASDARLFPEYAPDYMATFFSDPDGLTLEVTNYRQERRQLHDFWDATNDGQHCQSV
jgi:glyoxylase I family protein